MGNGPAFSTVGSRLAHFEFSGFVLSIKNFVTCQRVVARNQDIGDPMVACKKIYLWKAAIDVFGVDLCKGRIFSKKSNMSSQLKKGFS